LLAAELPPYKSRAILKSLGSDLSLERLQDSRSLSSVEKERISAVDWNAYRVAREEGIWCAEPPDYPPLLENSPGKPRALHVWGSLDSLSSPTVAIVGTRGASAYGRAAAIKFAEALGRAGVTVVSGGAVGIDAAAHRGALSVGGKTVAVLAGGVDRLYPAMNRGLFMDIRANGCLLSQFAVGSRPDRYKFLARNGMIAALSQAVIVIEAPDRSGSLRTAHDANDLGRQVFVVPATIDIISFKGSHALIRDGATLVDHPNQVLEAIGVSAKMSRKAAVAASPAGQKILEQLTLQSLSPEKIAELTQLDPHEVMAELTMLELDGHAVRAEGGYVKAL